VRIEHRIDRAEIILQVRVDAYDDVGIGGEEAGEQGVLVTAVSRELYSTYERVPSGKRFDRRPGPVLAAIIDKIDGASDSDLSALYKIE